MRGPAKLSLLQLFVVATVVPALLMVGTFLSSYERSRRSIVEASEAQRHAEAKNFGERLESELGVARDALEDVERAIRFGALRADDPDAVEARLFTELLGHRTLSDVTLTHAEPLAHAEKLRFDQAGRALIAPDHRWQVTVFRASDDPDSEVITQRITQHAGRFVADERRRSRGAGLLGSDFAPAVDMADVKDPTTYLTFETTAKKRYQGRTLWSDLSWFERDLSLPKERRRVVVTVQKAVDDAAGRFAGVVRVGLLTGTIDELPRRVSAGGSQAVFLCDREGRLVARLDPGDPIDVLGDDLRIVPTHVPPEIAAALKMSPKSGAFQAGGKSYLASFRPLQTSQDWVVGIVVPEDYYTGDLRRLHRRYLFTFLAVAGIIAVAGSVVLWLLRQSLQRVVASTARMRRFDFAPSPADAPLRDVQEVMDGVERAKTAMRALGKYVPIDLVRKLYESNREPELGGELLEISLMFTDIEGFSSLAEKLAPDALAQALGRYLETMTVAVHSTSGTVDKFIGDAVMAFWNAPTPLVDHARRACRAALVCMDGTRALYASDAWNGLPPLFTRYGLHSARVMVGHFGAPDRLSYTALGDGVNLAARLEPLCKQYDVAILASETIFENARDEFAFRLVDRVAVKGKSKPVRVYALLGTLSVSDDVRARTRTYEQALELYFARDFARARDAFRSQPDDPPSRVMAERCTAMIADPPPESWNGVYVAKSK